MKRLAFLSSIILAAAIATTTFLPRAFSDSPAIPAITSTDALHSAAVDAISADPTTAARAIKTLRDARQEGLNILLQTHAAAISGTDRNPTQWPRITHAIDEVAMQKDACVSQLYWYTDFSAAKAEAARTNKPILSLRMLGKLNEDLSCANSRFFRTTLYSNTQVSQYLRDHFILHWESVRPVPVITIDMGDGRKIVRTITGNSIHYILDARGRLVDAIPGLYGPQAFMEQMRLLDENLKVLPTLDGANFVDAVRMLHSSLLRIQSDAWKSDLAKAGGTLPIGAAGVTSTPTAVAAAPRAVSKFKLEAPILVQIMPDGKNLERATTDELWTKIAALHAQDATLDASAVTLIRAKAPADIAARVTMTKRLVEDPMLKVVRNLQDSIALDTVKNEYLLHSRIHEWLAQADKPVFLKDFNEKIYAELFLTPSSDPWLGLVPADAFSALDNGGVCAPTITAASEHPN